MVETIGDSRCGNDDRPVVTISLKLDDSDFVARVEEDIQLIERLTDSVEALSLALVKLSSILVDLEG